MIKFKAPAWAFACAVLFAPLAHAQTVTQARPVEGTVLSITAQGEANNAPDLATINLGVVTDGATAAAALEANATQMDALIQALRRAGIAERDIQTARINVNPQYDRNPRRVVNYQASNSVRARVRNLSNLGRIIDASVAAGGNTVNGIGFGFADADTQMDIARRDAITQATARANLYAQALGMRVVRTISVSESGGRGGGDDMIVVTGYRASLGSQAPTPVAPGEVTLNVTVTATYELR